MYPENPLKYVQKCFSLRNEDCWLLTIGLHKWRLKTPFPCCSLQRWWRCQSPHYYYYIFSSKPGKQMLQTFHFLWSFSSGILPFMLLVELFWWSIKPSFLICLSICQTPNTRKSWKSVMGRTLPNNI